MTEYTPGPWKWDWQNEDKRQAYSLQAKDGTAVLYPDQDSGIGIIVVWIDANTSLIAAAPDLLEALKAMRENYYDINSRCLALADAAIAKANASPAD